MSMYPGVNPDAIAYQEDGERETFERKDVKDIPVHGEVPKLQSIVDWVNETAALTQPEAIRYCDGSDAEWN